MLQHKQLRYTIFKKLVVLDYEICAIRPEIVVLPVKDAYRERQVRIPQSVRRRKWMISEGSELELKRYGLLTVTASQDLVPHVVFD